MVFGSVACANSQIDLESKVTERLGAAGDVLVQEFVLGLGIGFSCFIAHGEVFLRGKESEKWTRAARPAVAEDPSCSMQKWFPSAVV